MRLVRRAIPGILLMLLLWTILISDRGGDPVVAGVFGIVIALGVGLLWAARNAPPGADFHWPAVPAFLWFFLARSVLGGLDVAARALLPGRRVRPGFLEYQTDLPAGPRRTLFIACIGLLPGTLVVGVRGNRLRIHVLDERMAARADVSALEASIRALRREEA
ncbi:MAG: Na+/H+ antiporter subunit E [Halothiobacillaceae bacterium]